MYAAVDLNWGTQDDDLPGIEARRSALTAKRQIPMVAHVDLAPAEGGPSPPDSGGQTSCRRDEFPFSGTYVGM